MSITDDSVFRRMPDVEHRMIRLQWAGLVAYRMALRNGRGVARMLGDFEGFEGSPLGQLAIEDARRNWRR